MKIQISYLPTETTRALWVQTDILKLFPKAKVKACDEKPPGRVIYITVKEKPKNRPDAADRRRPREDLPEKIFPIGYIPSIFGGLPPDLRP